MTTRLVGGFNQPLWKIMEWVRQLGWWLPKESHNPVHGSSHHQPVGVAEDPEDPEDFGNLPGLAAGAP